MKVLPTVLSNVYTHSNKYAMQFETIGGQQSILGAIASVKDLEQYLKTTPVSLLGSQLLAAGRAIDERLI